MPRFRGIHLRRGQKLAAAGAVVVGGLLALRYPQVLRPTLEALAPAPLAPPAARVREVPAEQVVLARRRQGLQGLVHAAERRDLLSDAPGAALVLVDQELVAALLAALAPREYVIDGTYRVVVAGARVSFEDGLALVRLDGRASLEGAGGEVFADVTVVGDLELLREQERAEVLRARVSLLAVDVRRVDVVVDAREAEKLVERLGERRLADFAQMASELEIPVRQRYEVELPAVEAGPVRIEAATLPVALSVLAVRAFHGRLWVSMAASFDQAPPAGAPAPPPVAAPLPSPAPAASPDQLVREVEALRARFAALVDREPFVRSSLARRGDLVVAVPAPLFEDVVRRLADRYLDRVALRLDDLVVRKEGAVRKDTFLGEIHAGDWRVSLRFREVRGLLRAGAPRVRLPGGDRVEVDLPVHLEQASGAALARFAWDSRSVVNVICRDFEVEEAVGGRVPSRAYPVHGRFALAAGEDRLVARPSFDRRFRIHPEPSADSWSRVRAALDAQDRLSRCGMALDPDDVVRQLREMVARGFVVTLPDKLFRPVSLPTRLTPSVEVEGHAVEVVLTQSSLGVAPEGLWYSVDVDARLQ